MGVAEVRQAGSRCIWLVQYSKYLSLVSAPCNRHAKASRGSGTAGELQFDSRPNSSTMRAMQNSTCYGYNVQNLDVSSCRCLCLATRRDCRVWEHGTPSRRCAAR